MNLKRMAKKHKQYMIEMRREFHMYPEISQQEVNTSKRIKQELDSMGIPYVPCAGTGIIATIKGGSAGKTVALRADMDALEVTEKNQVPYASRNQGVSHACGHDGHMAMLLGAAKILNQIKDQLNGNVRLIFQPAEEELSAAGASAIIADGGLEGVHNIFGIHLLGQLPVGLISIGSGEKMSSADAFKITVTGKSGHGGMPEHCVDAIVAASAIVMNLQTIAGREICPTQPVVISIGKFNAGTRFNIIAGSAVLEGSTRCFSTEVGKMLPGIIERIAVNTAQAYRAEADLMYTYGVPPTINDAESASRTNAIVTTLYGQDVICELPPVTGSEDFAFYLNKIPGVFIFLGAMNSEKGAFQPQHHEEFNIDEDALEIGAVLHACYALDFLNGGMGDG